MLEGGTSANGSFRKENPHTHGTAHQPESIRVVPYRCSPQLFPVYCPIRSIWALELTLRGRSKSSGCILAFLVRESEELIHDECTSYLISRFVPSQTYLGERNRTSVSTETAPASSTGHEG